jgi:hypothetical protein
MNFAKRCNGSVKYPKTVTAILLRYRQDLSAVVSLWSLHHLGRVVSWIAPRGGAMGTKT